MSKNIATAFNTIEKLELEVKQLRDEIKYMRPRVEAYDTLSKLIATLTRNQGGGYSSSLSEDVLWDVGRVKALLQADLEAEKWAEHERVETARMEDAVQAERERVASEVHADFREAAAPAKPPEMLGAVDTAVKPSKGVPRI